ncbi:MAG TPA: LysR family transcriptional regulator [Fusobacteriaceae bacterium]|nr:LysR family transcriptional regulator [Fusobacteriaceae bacterium]
MEIRNLKSFKSIIEEGSFLKAAKKLHYTQSTITSHIQQLEEELQVKLFEKIGRKMNLSSFGKKLLPYVEELLTTEEKIMQLSKNKNLIKGTLKIAMGDSLVTYEFQDILSQFKKKAPHVKLSILTVDIVTMRELLEKGDVDIGFLFEDQYKGNCLIDIPFKKFPLTLVGPKNSNILNLNFDLKDQDLDISFIINEFHSPYRKIFNNHLQEKNISLNSLIEIWSIEGIKRSVKNNLGITYLPKFVMEEELARKELVEIIASCSNNLVEGIYSYHKNKYITSPMKLFMELVDKKYNI